MRVTWMPPSATADASRLVITRALRAFVDGIVSVLLADYLAAIGLRPLQIGAIITGTLLGSAALTLLVGLSGHRYGQRHLLLGASALMFATGLGFLGVTAFWPLFVVAVAGTLNPSSGDVSVFLPIEQAALSATADSRDRTALFARYNLSGSLAGALGALASAVPVVTARRLGWDLSAAERSGFALYAVVAVVVGLIYRRLSPALERPTGAPSAAPLVRSRRIVLRLATLFSLDAFGGGFIVQSLLALWLFRRFALPVETAACAVRSSTDRSLSSAHDESNRHTAGVQVGPEFADVVRRRAASAGDGRCWGHPAALGRRGGRAWRTLSRRRRGAPHGGGE